jgi:hypothetical protein
MKRALFTSTLVAAFGCAHAPAGVTSPPAQGNNIEFLFLPADLEAGFIGMIPISTHAICGDKGVFANAFLSVVVDSVVADGRPIAPDQGKGIYHDVGAPILIRPDAGFTFQVSQRDLEANFFEWSERRQPPGFVPPSSGAVRSKAFRLEADKYSPIDVVIRYRIRCADMTVSSSLSSRGQNFLALKWRNAGPANKPLQPGAPP